jgi:hypothetical protein
MMDMSRAHLPGCMGLQGRGDGLHLPVAPVGIRMHKAVACCTALR